LSHQQGLAYKPQEFRMNSSSRRSTKVLAPLAVLLAAGALAVGSGATFTSASSNSISSVTAGTLSHTNDKDEQAIFTAGDIKPGDTVTGTLTLTNTGSLAGTLSLTEVASTNTFVPGDLLLTIQDDKGTKVHDGEFGGLEDNVKKGLGTFAPGESRTYTYTVHLPEEAGDGNQGKTATASYSWDMVQLNG
jgi:spore coat-associated protein N